MADSGRVIVAMSGGVDSSVAAALLVRQGYAVTGVMLRFWSEPGEGVENRCCTTQALADARRVARALDIPFHVLDCRRRFKEAVVDTFVAEYARGRTPNPCVVCNHRIKFGYLLETARAAGASYLATGHYARIHRAAGSHGLRRAADPHKDQSYFLYTLSQDRLEHILFPLGHHRKEDVRAMAETWDLPVARKEESQDICFIRDQDYARFLRAYAPDTLKPGPILNREGHKLGEHEGLPLYTIGQRKGIGIGWSEPLYVLDKRMRDNALVVGPASELGRERFQVEEASFVSGEPPALPATVGVKIRSTGREVEATLDRGDGKTLSVVVEQSLRDVTPGQAAVFYRGADVLGGGTIACP